MNNVVNNDLKVSGSYSINDDYIDSNSISQINNTITRNKTLLDIADLISKKTINSNSGKSIKNCYIDKTLNILDIINTDDNSANSYSGYDLDVFKIPLSKIFSRFDATKKTISSDMLNFISSEAANRLTADFYVKKDGEKYSLYITNDIKTKVIKKLVEKITSNDNTDVDDAFENALVDNGLYDEIVNELITNDPKYAITMSMLKDDIKNVLIKISENIDESGIGTGYSVDNNVSESTYKKYISYSALRNTLCSFRLVYFDLIKRDCFNIILNMFLTQYKDTIKYNSDFLYFDYSEFDFNHNNRDKYKNIPRRFVNYEVGDILLPEAT